MYDYIFESYYFVFCLSHNDVADMYIPCFFFLMIRRPPRSTLDRSSAASDVYKRQLLVFGVTANTALFYKELQ